MIAKSMIAKRLMAVLSGRRFPAGNRSGFRVRTGLRAGGVLRNTFNAIPPSLRSYG